MSNIDIVLRYLQSIYPEKATNSDIGHGTGIQPHQQVFQITRKLRENVKITGYQIGREWYFQALTKGQQSQTNPQISQQPQETKMTPRSFEGFAREKCSDLFGSQLSPGCVGNVVKEWDMVSADGSIVGDAKYYTLVHGRDRQPAKFATIAEHVWLLEKTNAKFKFLVFGNQIEVPRLWLEKYGNLVANVDFYFMDDDGNITRL